MKKLLCDYDCYQAVYINNDCIEKNKRNLHFGICVSLFQA